jgi:uncharacterized membrane protein YbhN (UPF0104 family)
MKAKNDRRHRYAASFKWLVALCVLCYLFKRMDTGKIIDAMRFARLELYLPLAVFFVILWFLIEAQNLMFLFNMFGHDITFREMTLIRCASYMLMIINYNLGLGAIAWYLKQKNGIPLVRASSIMFFYFFVESIGITFFAMTGCLLIIRQSPFVYSKIVLTAGCMFSSYIALFFLYRFLPDQGLFKPFRNNKLMRSFHEATFSGYFKLSALRSLYFGSFIVFFYLGLRSFHVTVPFLTLTALVPVIFFIGNIPVTPFGIGTIQAAMLFFFHGFGQEENILSFSIVYSATLLFLRAPIGLIYLRKSNTGFCEIKTMTNQEA